MCKLDINDVKCVCVCVCVCVFVCVYVCVCVVLTAGVRLTWKLDPPPTQMNGCRCTCHVITWGDECPSVV